MGWTLLGTAPSTWAAAATLSPDEERKIAAAVPPAAWVSPRRPHRLLIFDLNVGYPGHRSIAHANRAFELMGRTTGVYQAEVSRDPTVFAPEHLERFDGVLLNNAVGNLFEDPKFRASLLDFVRRGGGLMGLHGTSVAFTRWPGAHEDWPEFGRMLGARGAAHRAADERGVVRVDDPTHPLNAIWPAKSFEFRTEYFRFRDPYSRRRVRVLLTLQPEDPSLEDGTTRPDHDYAVAWVRHYGRGRVFYSSVGHNPEIFWDPTWLQFYLGAVQFILGDLDVPTTPSAWLTPGQRARERLGWKLGFEALSCHHLSVAETAEVAARLGVPYLSALSTQSVHPNHREPLMPGVSAEALTVLRERLDAHGVRLLSWLIRRFPREPDTMRATMSFAQGLGVEVVVTEPAVEDLDRIRVLAEEFDLRIAIPNHSPGESSDMWHPDQLDRITQGRSPWIGVCADVGHWARAGIDPVRAVEQLADRILVLQLHDLDRADAQGRDVAWGTGVLNVAGVLEALARTGSRPVMLGLEYPGEPPAALELWTTCVKFADEQCIRLASAERP
jgi:sugar phosphate isomerase/epimerase/type 1 glutamine amidotransferase